MPIWELTLVAGSAWESGDELPTNDLWRPLQPLQPIRVNEADSEIWFGDLRQGIFRNYIRLFRDEGAEVSVWMNGRARVQLLKWACWRPARYFEVSQTSTPPCRAAEMHITAGA